MKKTNVTIKGYKYARVTATVGFKDGQRIRKPFYGKSMKEAENKRDEFLNGIEAGLPIDFDKATFGQLFERWFFNVKKVSVSPNTFARYELEYRLRILNSAIYSKVLTKITPLDMQEYYNGLIKEHSYNTVSVTDKVIRMFLRYCVDVDYIVKNPLRAVKLPVEHKIQDDGIKVFSLSDEALIKQYARDKHFIYLFDLLTGLRIGELLALNFNDIENNIVHVTKALNKEGTKIVPLKTKSSHRDVRISAKILPLLRQHIKTEKEKHLRLGINFETHHALFSSEACTYRPQRNVTKQWRKFLENYGIEYQPFKTLRSTFGTILAEKGLDLKKISMIMGHSTTRTTEKYYATIRKEKQFDDMSVMDNIEL